MRKFPRKKLALLAAARLVGRLMPLLLIALPLLAATPVRAEPEVVYFMSADGATEIAGYLFRPAAAGPHPAIVLLHGRSGPYSIKVNRDCGFVSRKLASPCNAAESARRSGRQARRHGPGGGGDRRIQSAMTS